MVFSHAARQVFRDSERLVGRDDSLSPSAIASPVGFGCPTRSQAAYVIRTGEAMGEG